MANRVRKIAEAKAELVIKWKYCRTQLNLADLDEQEGLV